VNILGSKDWVTVHNVESQDREAYMEEVAREMDGCQADLIGISAGFDNHELDWGARSGRAITMRSAAWFSPPLGVPREVALPYWKGDITIMFSGRMCWP